MKAQIKASVRLELEDLRQRLQEAEETLGAIRSGEVDALVVSGPSGEKVFTLEGAEHPYRVLVESMNEGAVSLSTMVPSCTRTPHLHAWPAFHSIGSWAGTCGSSYPLNSATRSKD
jgi:hypothetical protein